MLTNLILRFNNGLYELSWDRIMLNLYSYYQQPEQLPGHAKINKAIKLINYSSNWGGSITQEELEPIKHIIEKNAELASTYARKFTYKRWPEAEPYIMKDAIYAYSYAINILSQDKDWIKEKGHANGRWPDAEPFILASKNIFVIRTYAKNIIKGRWSEAEPIIMTNLNDVIKYAKDTLAEDPNYQYKNGRWPEAEPELLKVPDLAVDYVIDVTNERWPDLENIIKNSSDTWLWRRYKSRLKID